MGTINCPEVRNYESSLSPHERAEARDSYVRNFERQFSDWTDIAKVCIDVERDEDWKLLGFPSWNQWLMDAAPRSRAYIYLVVGRYKELSPDIPEEELAKIPLGSAGILKQLSPAVRKMSKIRLAAKEKPSKLRQVVHQECPDQHIEALDVRSLNFTESQALVFDEMISCYRAMNNGSATVEEAIEYLCSGWLDSTWEDSPYSNREKARQLMA